MSRGIRSSRESNTSNGGRELVGGYRNEDELSEKGSVRSLTSSSDRIKKFTSLQNLLDNAVGSCSDVDKVNFKYLHEVITEIIRYLGQSQGLNKRLQSNLGKGKNSDSNLALIRRIEETETFIRELATNVRRISSDIQKERVGPVNYARTGEVYDAISKLSEKLVNIDKKFSDYATKDCLKESISEQSITPEYVESIITENIRTCKCDIDKDIRRRDDKIDSLHDLVMNDIQFFEERIKMIAQKNKEMEERLQQKADNSALEHKCDRQEVETMAEETRTRNNSFHSEINHVKETVRLTSDSMTGIRRKNDEFSVHQKKFGGIIRRFETDVEEARNSIEYLKTSAKIQEEAKSSTEEAIAKIRIIQNNIEEKQRNFQKALEDLSDEYRRTDLRFANIADDIKTLRDQKANDTDVHNALASKLEQSQSVSNMKLNEFEVDIDQRLKDIAQKIEGNETNTKRWMDQIMDQFEKALCMKKNELKDIKTYIDERIRNIGQNGSNNNNNNITKNNNTNGNKNERASGPNKTSDVSSIEAGSNCGEILHGRTRNRPKKSPMKSLKPIPETACSTASGTTACTNCAETKNMDKPWTWATGGGWLKILIYLIFSHIISMFLVSQLGTPNASS